MNELYYQAFLIENAKPEGCLYHKTAVLPQYQPIARVAVIIL
ncbi:hypothetical protein [Emticicia sp. 21SJ11W-3]|nr:hypothetical protein [Emticicia sp. 21SJ11W-3]